MTTLTQDLIQLLRLEQKDSYHFLAQSQPLFGPRIFGGQLLAQSIISAASSTHFPLHSLHAYFLAAGDAAAPLVYKVECLRDSTSFSTRQVTAIQHGQRIFRAQLSYMNIEAGLEYQISEPEMLKQYPVSMLQPEEWHKQNMSHQVAAEYLPTFLRPFHLQSKPIEFALKDKNRDSNSDVLAQNHYAEYLKLHNPLAAQDDHLYMHQAIAAYYSDYNLYTAALKTHALNYLSTNLSATSLDHVMYFHHPFRVENWMYYDMQTSCTSQARGLTHGQMWQNGKLVCSTMQENLMRYTS